MEWTTNLKYSQHTNQYNRYTVNMDHTLCMFVDNVSLTTSSDGVGDLNTIQRHEDVYNVPLIECFDNIKTNLKEEKSCAQYAQFILRNCGAVFKVVATSVFAVAGSIAVPVIVKLFQ